MKVSYDMIKRLAGSVCDMIDEDTISPDRIVCMAPSGVLFGKMLSEYYDAPFTSISWSDEDEKECNCWIPEDALAGEVIFVVSDITNTNLNNSLCSDFVTSCAGKEELLDNVIFISLFESVNEDFKADYVGDVLDGITLESIELPWENWWQ